MIQAWDLERTVWKAEPTEQIAGAVNAKTRSLRELRGIVVAGESRFEVVVVVVDVHEGRKVQFLCVHVDLCRSTGLPFSRTFQRLAKRMAGARRVVEGVWEWEFGVLMWFTDEN